MKHGLLFALFCFLSVGTFSQVEVTGKVLDAATSAPLAYGAVKIKGTSRGVLTNGDGAFRLNCQSSDTLEFKYLSYQTHFIPVTRFVKNPVCRMELKKNQLSTVVVNADEDFLYDLLVQARKKLKKTRPYSSKTYFLLETESNERPVEQIECYYNADLSGSGLKKMGLKNGRIGMAKFEDDYFVSLNTTDILCDYNLFIDRQNDLPANPLQMSMREMKKKYKLVLIGLDGSRYKIKFIARDKKEDFDGYLWLDADTDRILSISLKSEDLKRHPFIPLHKTHRIEKIDFELTYTFESENQRVERIDLKYLLDYNNSKGIRPVKTTVVSLFYDDKKLFKLPFYQDGSLLSDYDKIVTRPHNAMFWKYNEVVIPSERVSKNRRFFEENGVLLNFDQLSTYYERFSNRKIPWSEDRLFRDEINNYVHETYSVGFYSPRPGTRIRTEEMTPTSWFDLQGQIFLDVNQFEDSLHFITSTLLDLDVSYYGQTPDRYSNYFINTYFDLIEIARLRLEQALKKGDWDMESVDAIYEAVTEKLDRDLLKLHKAMLNWEKDSDLRTYTNLVLINLGIDNSMLIVPKRSVDWLTDREEARITVLIERYFYAYNLLKAEQYELAIKEFMDYANFGERHHWFYRNMAIAHLAIGDEKNACQFFDLCESFGGRVAEEYRDNCKNGASSN